MEAFTTLTNGEVHETWECTRSPNLQNNAFTKLTNGRGDAFTKLINGRLFEAFSKLTVDRVLAAEEWTRCSKLTKERILETEQWTRSRYLCSWRKSRGTAESHKTHMGLGQHRWAAELRSSEIHGGESYDVVGLLNFLKF